MIRCVIFDFDGTLVDSNEIKRDCFLVLASEYSNGVTLMERVLSDKPEATRSEVFHDFVSAVGLSALDQQAKAEELIGAYNERSLEMIRKAPAITGVDQALRSLASSGIRLFISSATPTEMLLEAVAARRLDGWMDGVFGAPETKASHVRRILRAGLFQLNEILYVGDSDSDVATAEEVGCAFVGVCLGRGRFSTLPPKCITSLEGLPEIVASLGATSS